MAQVLSCTLERQPQCVLTYENITYTGRYKIETDEAMQGRIVAAAAVLASPDPLPVLRDFYNVRGLTDLDVQCSSVDVRTTNETDTQHVAEVRWESPDTTDQTRPPDLAIEPFQRKPVWRCDWQTFRIRRDKAKCTTRIRWQDGDYRLPDQEGPVTNAAGDQWGPEHTLEDRRPVLSYQRNVATAFGHIDLQEKYGLKINNLPWDAWHLETDNLVLPGNGYTVFPGVALVYYFTSSGPQYWQEVPYWTLECRVILDKDRWQIFQENLGNAFFELVEDDPIKRSNPVDDRGWPISPPFPLTQEGLLGKKKQATFDEEIVETLLFVDRETENFETMMADIKAIPPAL